MVLLGQGLKIFTNYKSITCKYFNTDSVLQWRLVYTLDIEYILVDKNIAADALL